MNLDNILKQLSSKRLAIDQYLFERFVNGSSDRVLEAIQSQINDILDEYDATLTNVFHEITTEFNELRQAITKLRERTEKTCCKGQCFSRHTR